MPDGASQPVTAKERCARLGQRGAVIWLTGLSGAGKTTLARAAERALFERGAHVVVLDGDAVRTGLCADLGFSLEARAENIRRMGEVARLFQQAGQIVLVSAISPMQSDRDRARALIPPPDFIEVHCACPLAVCEQRDPKGLYRKARTGELPQFTGISSPYEAPNAPELVIDSATTPVEQAVSLLLAVLAERGIFSGAVPIGCR